MRAELWACSDRHTPLHRCWTTRRLAAANVSPLSCLKTRLSCHTCEGKLQWIQLCCRDLSFVVELINQLWTSWVVFFLLLCFCSTELLRRISSEAAGSRASETWRMTSPVRLTFTWNTYVPAKHDHTYRYASIWAAIRASVKSSPDVWLTVQSDSS